MLHGFLKGVILLALVIGSAVCTYRTSLVYDYRQTGIFFLSQNFFDFFFLLNVVPLILTGKGMTTLVFCPERAQS